jgi:hypothetical protein
MQAPALISHLFLITPLTALAYYPHFLAASWFHPFSLFAFFDLICFGCNPFI